MTRNLGVCDVPEMVSSWRKKARLPAHAGFAAIAGFPVSQPMRLIERSTNGARRRDEA
jgi:hypothetical protein